MAGSTLMEEPCWRRRVDNPSMVAVRISNLRPLAAAWACTLHYLRAGGENLICNCGYERGYSVLQVIEAVKTISGVDFPV
jgi:UDP-glucose 4-epimerase